MATTQAKLIVIFIFTFCSCSNQRKEDLREVFVSFHARNVPLDIFSLDKLNDFDILKQKKETINEGYYYPDTFVLGLDSDKNKIYDRIHVIKGFSPVEEYKLVKVASDHYTTDTTYLDNIQLTDTVIIDNKDVHLLKDTMRRISINEMQSSYKMNNKKYIGLIYRKVNPLKDSTGQFIMWKREIFLLKNNTLKTETLNKMNGHFF